MSTVYATCPGCSQPVEVDQSLANQGVQCPNCSGQFIPATSGNATTPLEHLRSKTHYPELRQLIAVIFWIGLVLLCLWALLSIVGGVITSRDTTTDAIGTDTALAGVGYAVLAALWWKLFRPLASLMIDIADACIEISRRRN
jgi:DNA-directed RNA polymerase subunit RPC12/RpoP